MGRIAQRFLTIEINAGDSTPIFGIFISSKLHFATSIHLIIYRVEELGYVISRCQRIVGDIFISAGERVATLQEKVGDVVGKGDNIFEKSDDVAIF